MDCLLGRLPFVGRAWGFAVKEPYATDTMSECKLHTQQNWELQNVSTISYINEATLL